jgi:sulfate permease, SulP family
MTTPQGSSSVPVSRGSTSPWIDRSRTLGRDAAAGAVASILLVANIVSFGALMFPGELSAGTPLAIWAMLVGSCIGGAWIALTTSLPPLATGIDSPTGAVLVLLSAATGHQVLASGGTPQAAIQTVMLVFSAATVLTGALLYSLGALRLGHCLRFVPYFVVAGFLTATGWLLIAGGMRMTTGRSLTFDGVAAAWSASEALRLGSALATVALLMGLRRWVKSALALPATLLAACLAGGLALEALGLSEPGAGWYLPSLGILPAWSPLDAIQASRLSWPMALQLVPEMLAVTIVALVSLVTKASSIEVSRKTYGDLDCELRSHGLGTLLAAPFGGIVSSLQTGTSLLLEKAGGATRLSGAAAALLLGVVAVTGLDLPGLVPIPVLAGLVFYLGIFFITDALSKPLARRDWANVLLAVGIAAVCARYGYLVGVLGGVVCACLLFAASYARVGAVRQHLSRAQFTSNVSRSASASAHLAAAGDAIQVYWLSGYIFFGSSEGVFERVRRDIEALPPRRVACVILDFGAVSGKDSSATMSLAKLRNFCVKHRTTLVCSTLSPTIHQALERDGFFDGNNRQHVFADLNLALAWCENQLLAQARVDAASGLGTFETWLQQELGERVGVSEFMAYLERREVDAPQVLYREGDPSDNIDLVAAGTLGVDIAKGNGQPLRVRTITTHTVVGEMGFFRRSPRSATVSSDGPATFFTLTRRNFERMRHERPDLASAFDDFLMRVLAERITSSERTVVALSR